MKNLFIWKQEFYFILFMVLTASSCTVYKPVESPDPQVRLPDTFSTGESLPPVDKWWLQFENRELETLMDEALSENLTLRMAWSRLDQARQQAKIAGAGRFPGLEAGAGAQHQHTGGDTSLAYPPSLNSFYARLSLSYQVDLWKKIENSRLASVFTFEAGREELDATAITVAANVAEIWISLMEQKAFLKLLDDQLEIAERYLKLVESRFGQGISSAVDVYQQKQQVESLKEQFPRTRMQLKLLEHQLAVMLGRPSVSVLQSENFKLPEIKGLPPAGVPSVVLRNRPDVKAAELRLIAADHRLAAAIADRFPSINLSAGITGQTDKIENAFNQWVSTLAGSLAGPVFDAGRRKSEADRNRAVVRELFYRWKASLINAFTEVEDTLVTEEGLLDTYRSTKSQVELAELTLERSRSLYVNGLTDYLTVLTSLRALQNLERAEITIKKSLISNRIKLHSALGGDWPGRLVEPEHTITTDQKGGQK